MIDSATSSPISEEAAVLIERAVRGEISPEQRTRLDELVAADPVVAEELQRAKREEGAMNTAAMLLSERSDPERMRRAIEQKLKHDSSMMILVGGCLLLWAPIYFLFFGSAQTIANFVWTVVLPIAPLALWIFMVNRRRHRLRQAVAYGDSAIIDEYTRHLTEKQNEFVLGQAALIIVLIALTLSIVADVASGQGDRAVLLGLCLFVLLIMGKRVLLQTSVSADELDSAGTARNQSSPEPDFQNETEPERMKRAIEQKASLDRKSASGLLIGLGFMAALSVYWLIRGEVVWIGFAFIALCIVELGRILWRQRVSRRLSDISEDRLRSVYSNHLRYSRLGAWLRLVVFLSLTLGLAVWVFVEFYRGNTHLAIFILVMALIPIGTGWKHMLSRSSRRDYHRFLEGRLTLEELFEKRAESSESDGE